MKFSFILLFFTLTTSPFNYAFAQDETKIKKVLKSSQETLSTIIKVASEFEESYLEIDAFSFSEKKALALSYCRSLDHIDSRVTSIIELHKIGSELRNTQAELSESLFVISDLLREGRYQCQKISKSKKLFQKAQELNSSLLGII
jgi:hypothetical protein